jgi:UDP:flavonoid glycosyltransferase YjiC (YdhE family)
VDLAARHGMAIAVAPRHAGTPRLADAVRRVLGDPGFRAHAQRVQGWYAGWDGPARAADAILQHLAAQAEGGRRSA